MSNLTLYSATCLIILDSEGNRVIAKYWSPPHQPASVGQGVAAASTLGGNPFGTLKEQRAFEKNVCEKTRKGLADVLFLPPSSICLTKSSTDLTFHLVGPTSENELMLQNALTAFHDAVGLLLRGLVEKRSVLENLDLVMLALDETIDDGIILETDPVAIASRVSRPRADTAGEIVINEQTIMSAYSTLKERLGKQIAQL
ncbi:Vesicle coat complex COPI, zeta subunit [Phaffia rhodozyma]|uniref:Coatomer subunit zeta n=1 Tax=Phaffia rhodozyma TaxID=264483 RepID=A0A0F7SVV9_PHARH|nr:Vesicle coat complex COPI, zeta subunit [Phaffia rhodozyma]